LHYHPGNASFAVHALLRELALPFELQLVDRARAEHKSPAYLKLNPNGQIPVLVDGEVVLYETVAIMLHLLESHPNAGLAPPVGSAQRPHFLKWMVWMTNTLQPALMQYFYPERLVAEGNAAGAAEVKARAIAKVGECLAQLDEQMQRSGGPWLLGASYSAADILAFLLCRWTRGFALAPAREYPHIGPYLQRVLGRPAVQQTIAAEGLAAPLV
jgi:glutathione S-transferase